MLEHETLLDLGQEWRELAACSGRYDDLFFPINEAEKSAVRAAKAVCQTCPVQTDCLSYALETGQAEEPSKECRDADVQRLHVGIGLG